MFFCFETPCPKTKYFCFNFKIFSPQKFCKLATLLQRSAFFVTVAVTWSIFYVVQTAERIKRFVNISTLYRQQSEKTIGNMSTLPPLEKFLRTLMARGLLNYHLKFCWLKVICCICQSNELECNIKHKKLGGPAGGQQKSGGRHGPPRPPVEQPLHIIQVNIGSGGFKGKRARHLRRVFRIQGPPWVVSGVNFPHFWWKTYCPLI